MSRDDRMAEPTGEAKAERVAKLKEGMRDDHEISVTIDLDKEKLPENEMKFDQESIPVQLLPTIPLLCVARGYGYGARKYFANSWRRRDRRAVSWMRTYGSILRHLLKWAAGEEWDRESVERGQPMKHLWFAATQLFILIEHTETGMGDDDRHKNEDEDLRSASEWPRVESD